MRLPLILLLPMAASSFLHSYPVTQRHIICVHKDSSSVYSLWHVLPGLTSSFLALKSQSLRTHDIQKIVATSDTVKDFRSGEIPLICIPKAVNCNDVESWKRDAVGLKKAGFGATAGVVTKSANHIRAKVHQIWLQHPDSSSSSSSSCSIRTFVGDVDGRKSLFRFIENLRHELTTVPTTEVNEVESDSPSRFSLPPDLVELSYLIYDANGAYYTKHIDAPKKQQQRCRAVSFLLYLGSDDGSDAEWNCGTDGGALRIHGEQYARHVPADGGAVVDRAGSYGDDEAVYYADITPLPGTMVLFESTAVLHEVMPTNRGRVCIVGWFGTTIMV